MKTINEMKLSFESKSINEGFSRVAVASFASALDPTLEELNDIKTAVSEAVTNAIVHGYREKMGKIYITASITDKNIIRIKVRDRGVGIEDIEPAAFHNPRRRARRSRLCSDGKLHGQGQSPLRPRARNNGNA